MPKGLLLIVSGPSGSGKGTVCKELLNRNQDIEFSISVTTRKPRKGEAEGVDYFFVGVEEFQNMIENQEFLEYAKVHNNYYGTPEKEVLKKLNQGKNIILEIDVQGALQVKEKFPEGVLIFILPPSMEELKNRIVKRGTESKEEIDVRLANAYNEIKLAKEYDYIVINDEVPGAVDKIESIMVAENNNTIRQKGKIEQVLAKEG